MKMCTQRVYGMRVGKNTHTTTTVAAQLIMSACLCEPAVCVCVCKLLPK